jgi:hypothetical protein
MLDHWLDDDALEGGGPAVEGSSAAADADEGGGT